MKKLPIIILSTAMLAASTLPSLAKSIYGEGDTSQQAKVIQVDDNWRHRHDDYHRSDWNGDRHHHHHGNAGAIIGGLAAGAIIGGALANDHDRRYYRERRDYYYDDSY